MPIYLEAHKEPCSRSLSNTGIVMSRAWDTPSALLALAVIANMQAIRLVSTSKILIASANARIANAIFKPGIGCADAVNHGIYATSIDPVLANIINESFPLTSHHVRV